MQRLLLGTGQAASSGSCPDPEFARRYPILVEYLTSEKYDDGLVRERSALSMFCEDGMIKLALNDRDVGASLYCSSTTFGGALEALEGMLQRGPDAGWRVWKKSTKRK